MPTYRWTGRKPLRRNGADDPDDRFVEEGEEFEVNPDEEDGDNDDPVGRAFGDLVERVDGDGEVEGRGASEGAGPPEEVRDLLEGTVADVEEALESGDYDDRLDDVEEYAERAGVQDAVEDRR